LFSDMRGRPRSRGLPWSSSNKQGPRLLSNPSVKAAIDAGKVKRSEKLDVDAEYILERLVAEVEADLADLYTDSGDLKPIDEWPEIWRRGLVVGVEIEALFDSSGKDRVQIGHTKKIKLSDRVRRLELIGKHVGVNAFQNQVVINDVEGLADRLVRARQRMDSNV
jgi:phage terminase small subunit